MKIRKLKLSEFRAIVKNMIKEEMARKKNNGISENYMDDGFDADEGDSFGNNSFTFEYIKDRLGDPFTNNADWGGAYVWNLQGGNKFEGTFLFFGDDDIVVLQRSSDDEGDYSDNILMQVNSFEDLQTVITKYKKINEQRQMKNKKRPARK
jgi:hypothetical protein